MKRRDLLRALGIGGGTMVAVGAGHGVINGFRFPIIQFEPSPRPSRVSLLDPQVDVSLEQAYLKHVWRTEDGLKIAARAFGPEPSVQVRCPRALAIHLEIGNLSGRAERAAGGALIEDEEVTGPVTRRAVLRLTPGSHEVAYKVPFSDSFRFGVVGDSGGGSELAWCLERSAQLGADFMLHAGDFFYSQADFSSLPGVLERSPVPVYASIGNHDFHDDGRYVHRDFTYHVGPRNFYFRLGETTIASFDTGAGTWPAGSGKRADLLDQLATRASTTRDWVFMTHRPLHDPPEGSASGDEERALSGYERHWLIERLKRLVNRPVVLSGHIHDSIDYREDGISSYVSGEGLGSRNLASGREIARILIGEKSGSEPVAYEWRPLKMPATSYCHYKNRETLRLMGKPHPEGSFGVNCPG